MTSSSSPVGNAGVEMTRSSRSHAARRTSHHVAEGHRGAPVRADRHTARDRRHDGAGLSSAVPPLVWLSYSIQSPINVADQLIVQLTKAYDSGSLVFCRRRS